MFGVNKIDRSGRSGTKIGKFNATITTWSHDSNFHYFSGMNNVKLPEKKRILAFNIYLVLASIFIASLVVSNLIFQKFFSWDFLGWYDFEISVGILPYPITFLVTDLISEIYGRKKANQVVITGIFASAFSLLIIMVSDAVPATGMVPGWRYHVSQSVWFIGPCGICLGYGLSRGPVRGHPHLSLLEAKNER